MGFLNQFLYPIFSEYLTKSNSILIRFKIFLMDPVCILASCCSAIRYGSHCRSASECSTDALVQLSPCSASVPGFYRFVVVISPIFVPVI